MDNLPEMVDQRTFREIVRNGQIDVVQHLASKGYIPEDESSLQIAILSQNVKMVELLLSMIGRPKKTILRIRVENPNILQMILKAGYLPN